MVNRAAEPGHPEQNDLHPAIRAARTDLSRSKSAIRRSEPPRSRHGL
jgi:hypothetical protein